MARYKVTTQNFENPQLKLARKRECIRKTVEGIWCALMILGILICGLNQHNALITGWGLIIMGLITIPLAAFFIYIQNKEWKPMFWWNHSEIGYYGDTKTNEKNLAEYRFILGFSTVVSLLFAIVLPILGVLRLLGIV